MEETEKKKGDVVVGDITAGQLGNGQPDGGYVSPYEGFKGSGYGDAIKWLEGRVAEYKPESEKDKLKRERAEKRERWLSGVADVLGGMHRAYSYGRGVKPMELTSASEKTRQRIEKAKAEREGERDRAMNYAIMLGNLKAKDREFGFNVAKADVGQRNWREQMDMTRAQQDRAAEQWNKEFDLKKGRYEKADEQWQSEFDWKKERAKVADDQWDKEYRLKKSAASGDGSGGGSTGGGSTGYVAYDKDGNAQSFNSYQEAIDFAIGQGTAGEYVQDGGGMFGGDKKRFYPMRPGMPGWKDNQSGNGEQSGGNGGGGYGGYSI